MSLEDIIEEGIVIIITTTVATILRETPTETMETGEKSKLQMIAVCVVGKNEVTVAQIPITKKEMTRTATPRLSARCTETDVTNIITPAVQATNLPPITREDTQKSAAATVDP